MRISLGLLGLCGLLTTLLHGAPSNSAAKVCQSKAKSAALFKPSRFLTLGGGGAPSYNEIAIEKNVLYFQRTLDAMGLPGGDMNILFANGTDGQKTVRYVEKGVEKFKAPTVPGILGESSIANLTQALSTVAEKPQEPLFFYFTGHGADNPKNLDNNAMILWKEELLSVQRFSLMLDELPQQKPVVAVMVQCYSGSFANLIYEGGNPKKPVAQQNRCGFFATVKSLPSVGCTPEVNEADYQDYSSSFFAGLSGIDRVGKVVEWADYDKDGRVSYREAHSFAKIDEQASDLPISTSESWLERQINPAQTKQILREPLRKWLDRARPEQAYVVENLAKRLSMNLEQSFVKNKAKKESSELEQVYRERLRMELRNIGAEMMVRESRDGEKVAVLDRLLKCEGGSWK
jgi:hypothetical protein